MDEKLLDLDEDYEFIKNEFMSFLDEDDKDRYFDAFIKLAIY